MINNFIIYCDFQTIKLTNLILGDVVNDGVDLTDQIGMAFRELYVNLFIHRFLAKK